MTPTAMTPTASDASARRTRNPNAPRAGAARGLRAPAQDRLHPQDQLPHRERLHDVVLGAELEPEDAIDLFAPRGEHEHRNAARLRLRLQRATDLVAGEVRQHEVEDD